MFEIANMHHEHVVMKKPVNKKLMHICKGLLINKCVGHTCKHTHTHKGTHKHTSCKLDIIRTSINTNQNTYVHAYNYC